MSESTYLAQLAARFPPPVEEIDEPYPASAFAGAANPHFAALARAVGDARFVGERADARALDPLRAHRRSQRRRLAAWPPLAPDLNPRLNFGVESTVIADFIATACAFWRRRFDLAFAAPAP